ncbi:uncharacterized protein METZ01_LOCUS350924, partial [marine metagenome]
MAAISHCRALTELEGDLHPDKIPKHRRLHRFPEYLQATGN